MSQLRLNATTEDEMPEIDVLERTTPDEPAQTITLVDCDIHPQPNSPEELERYCSAKWREELRHHSDRFALWTPHFGWFGAFARDDFALQEGETHVEALAREVLDEYGVDYGVLTSFP